MAAKRGWGKVVVNDEKVTAAPENGREEQEEESGDAVVRRLREVEKHRRQMDHYKLFMLRLADMYDELQAACDNFAEARQDPIIVAGERNEIGAQEKALFRCVKAITVAGLLLNEEEIADLVARYPERVITRRFI